MARKDRPLDGRPAVITGAASGIGRSLARRLSRAGSPVAIADIDETGLKDTARSLPGPVLIRVLDVRDAADQHRFAAEVREWLAAQPNAAQPNTGQPNTGQPNTGQPNTGQPNTGQPGAARLGAVFNNAGVAVASSVLEADPGDDEWLRQTNFDGVVNGTRAFLPLLVEQDDGVIVNTSSVFGLLGMPYQSAYCASKFAVRGFTEALRQELRGTGVRAVTVHPGGITTNIARNARVRQDPEGRGRTHEQMAADFEAITMTSPDKAAETICRGVERGKARILVGPDAHVFDALARIAPTHYYDIMARFEKRLRSRQAGSR
jgi:NAD(P)-dependent dehydrogenase (short-subunit alcohol dehydrogenase family)